MNRNLKICLKITTALLAGLTACSVCGGCSENPNQDKPHPTAVIRVRDYGDIELELYQDVAPNTVANFISLAKDGFYNGLTFHRIISDFMIQGGDPKGTGTGGPGYHIKGEFANNGFKTNDISHKRGVLSMARAQMPDSAGSQFFVMHADGEFLDGDYAAFGAVIEGMETVDEIAAAKTDWNDRPREEQKIKKATAETFGAEYEEPAKA